MASDKSNLLTTGQAANLCSVTADTILKWIKRGRLGAARTAGGHHRIRRGDLDPLVATSRAAPAPSRRLQERPPPGLRCWEYLAEGDALRDDCRRCVVYRVQAARCFLMAGLEADVGHARHFCQNSCEDCVYYRRVKGLVTNVLVITADQELSDGLAAEQHEGIAVRFAKNAYEASAIIHDFRPAFAVVDLESLPPGDSGLLHSLAADPRVPGVKITVVVPPGTAGWEYSPANSDLVVSVLKKPFGNRQITAVINSFPVDSQPEEDSHTQAPLRGRRR